MNAHSAGAAVKSGGAREAEPSDPGFIDVRELARRYRLEELNKAADEYYAQREGSEYFFSKPLALTEEAPFLLIQFAKLLQGLRLLPDHRVLDFGAGSCWTSRWMTQMGCKVYALDISPAALRIGARLYEILPVIGEHPAPEFVPFDGLQIPLADASMNRVCCFDAFHHVSNPETVLREMARVLKLGGIAGFAEPGPDHSRVPQSQWEMKNFTVLENDIVIEEIWAMAKRAGFADLAVVVADAGFHSFPLRDFDRFVRGDAAMDKLMADKAREFLRKSRTFFLSKHGTETPDSRTRSGLAAEIRVELDRRRIPHEAGVIKGQARVKNVGPQTWLPTTARVGAVHLGGHLLDADSKMMSYEFFRTSLTPGVERPVAPGEEIEVELRIPAPPRGAYILEFDMVSEWICWFSANGSPTEKIGVEIV
jgi:SAM-dependent methyltransferase